MSVGQVVRVATSSFSLSVALTSLSVSLSSSYLASSPSSSSPVMPQILSKICKLSLDCLQCGAEACDYYWSSFGGSSACVPSGTYPQSGVYTAAVLYPNQEGCPGQPEPPAAPAAGDAGVGGVIAASVGTTLGSVALIAASAYFGWKAFNA